MGMKGASPAPGDWDAHPSAAFQAKVSRREVGAQRRPGPVCPAQGPRGLWAGAYGANPGRLRGGGGQVRRAALGGSRGHRALEDREGAGAAGSARMRGGRSRARGRGPAPPGGPPARAPRRRDPAPAGCVAPERLPNPSVRPHAPESCFEYYFAVDVFKVVFPSSAPNNSPRLLVTKARFGIPLPSSPGSGPRPWGRPAPALYPQSLFQRLLKQPLGGALLQCAPRPPFTPARMEGCEC